MKKKFFAILMASALCLTLSACHDKEDLALIEKLQGENADLAAQVQTLESKLASLQSTLLHSWSLTAVPTADGSFASVSFQAKPGGMVDGQKATFEVMRGEEVELSLPCLFDGESFTASAELNAENGYSFFCTLSDGGSASERFALVDPANEALPYLSMLADSLNTYCSLTSDPDSFEVTEEALAVDLVAQIQLPRFMNPDEPVAVEKAQLLYTMGEETLDTKEVVFEEGESGLLECKLDATSFKIPAEMETDAQLNVKLVVTLTNGQELTSADVVGWYKQEDTFKMVAG